MSLVQHLGRKARTAGALAALLVVSACVTEKPVIEATGPPVGPGVNVPAGSNEDFIVNVGRRIYFDEGSAELNDTAKVTLKSQAEWLTRHARYRVKLEGFADDRTTSDSS